MDGFDASEMPTTRAEALQANAPFYFTGKPCKHGHIVPRYQCGGCVVCYRASAKASKVARREKSVSEPKPPKKARGKAPVIKQEPDTILPLTGKAARAIGARLYFSGLPCKRGHVATRYASTGDCVECNREKAAARYAADPEAEKAKVKAYKSANPDWKRAHNSAYKKRNPDKVNAQRRKSRLDPRQLERDRAYSRDYKLKNRAACTASENKRRAQKLDATPVWLNEAHIAEIDGIYLYRQIFSLPGRELVVDHSIPLNSKTVCGLHVPCNLVPMTTLENDKKGNRYGHADALGVRPEYLDLASLLNPSL